MEKFDQIRDKFKEKYEGLPPEVFNKYTRALGNYTPDSLNNVIETSDKDIEKPFDNHVGADAASFDVIIWNIYSVLTDHYRNSATLKNRALWVIAHKHAVIIAANLSKTNYQAIGSETSQTVLEHLLSLAKEKKIKKISLNKNFDFSFSDKDGNVLFSFNAAELRRSGILASSREERLKIQEVPLLGGKKAGAPDSPLTPDPSVDALFIPMGRAPRLPYNERRLKFSYLDLYRAQKQIPSKVPSRKRGGDMCAYYVERLLTDEFSLKERQSMGLVFSSNAWDFKHTLARNNAIEMPPLNTFDAVQVEGSTPPSISNYPKYYDSVGKFYTKADQGSVPSILTVYFTNTNHYGDVLKANRSRSPEFRSYNSHVALVLGRESQRSGRAFFDISASALLKSRLPKVNPLFYANLNVEIHRKNGEIIRFDGRGIGTFGNTILENGDEIKWQDVLVSDFIHGKERLLGLAEFAAKGKFVILENLTFKNPHTYPPEYSAIGYFQVKRRTPLSLQIKSAIGPSTFEDYSNYIIALENAGIDPDAISPNDILPIFDPAKLRERFKDPSEKTRIHTEFMRTKVDRYNEREDRTGVFALIEEGKSPWSTFGPIFEKNFSGNGSPLSEKEKNFILYAVDASSTAIDLREVRITTITGTGETKVSGRLEKYSAGTAVFLSDERVNAIVAYVKHSQEALFTAVDYTHIVSSGDSPYKFVSGCFDQESTEGFRYKDLDSIEKDYLFKAFKACNDGKDVDLATESKTVNGQTIIDFKDFRPGARIIFRKADLLKCLAQIKRKRKLQSPLRTVAISVPSGDEGEREKKEIPPEVMQALDKVYPSGSLVNLHIRNMLCLSWVKEQGAGWQRRAAKLAWNVVSEANSAGEFQIRPSLDDLTPECLKLLKQNGFSLDNYVNPDGSLPTAPKRRVALLEKLRKLNNDEIIVSTILAGQRISSTMQLFRTCSQNNGEDYNLMDEDVAIMTLTSYNRGFSSVLRTMFQNWALKIGKVAGIDISPLEDSFDGLLKIDRHGDGVLDETKEAYLKLQDPDGLIRWDRALLVRIALQSIVAAAKKAGVELSGEALAQVENIKRRRKFLPSDIKGPLFVAMKQWYENQTGEKLSVTVSAADRRRKDRVFSYGSYSFERGGQRWADLFQNYDGLNSLILEMRGDYVPATQEEERMLLASDDSAKRMVVPEEDRVKAEYPIRTLTEEQRENLPTLNSHGYISILLTGRDAKSGGSRADTIKQILIDPRNPSDAYVVNVSRDIDVGGVKLNDLSMRGPAQFHKAVEEITGEEIVHTVDFNFDTFKTLAGIIIKKLGKFQWRDPNGYSYIEVMNGKVLREWPAEIAFTDPARLLTFARARYVRQVTPDGRELTYDGSDTSRQMRQVQIMMQLASRLRAAGIGVFDIPALANLAENNMSVSDMYSFAKMFRTGGLPKRFIPISTATAQREVIIRGRSFQQIDRPRMRQAVVTKLLPGTSPPRIASNAGF
ncbi:MAG: hypothetical protein WC285_03710 [Candidatus Gracilibacteria bacterium]|jgi:anionic cell wall polymer biosynthesis LytR-Cps2A-Psr (LCP) family protein